MERKKMMISGSEEKIFAKGVIGRVRKAQEDSYGVEINTPNGALFVVCDGMGGHVGGAIASRIGVDSIVSYMQGERHENAIEALNGALQFANMQVLGYADANPENRGMGTTACVVLIREDGMWIAHVGDSRIYLYLGKERELHRLTKDHSYVQTLVDAGEISEEEAEHHPQKNRITKALGIRADVQPTFNPYGRAIVPKNGDVVMICSDGLSGMISDKTMARVLGEKTTLRERGERLIELAMEGETVVPGGQDNCTVELIEIDKSGSKESVFRSMGRRGSEDGEETKVRGKKLWLVTGVICGLVVVGDGTWLGVTQWRKMRLARTEEAIEQNRARIEELVEKKGETEESMIANRARRMNKHGVDSTAVAQYTRDSMELRSIVDRLNEARRDSVDLQEKVEKMKKTAKNGKENKK